jgi:hypothetical protein
VIDTTPILTTTTGTGGAYSFNPVKVGAYVATVEMSGLVGDPNPFSQFAVSSGTNAGNINFQLLPPKIYGSGLNLVSFPFDYTTSGPDARSILGLSAGGDNDGNGTVNAADAAIFNNFRMAEWTGTDWSIGASIPVRLGKGYFINAPNTLSVARTGQPWPASTFTIELTPGWNLIGHPFANVLAPTTPAPPIDMSTAMVQNGSQTVSLSQAVANGWVAGSLFEYQGTFGGLSSQYSQTTTMRPWFGYWFRNTTAGRVNLILSYPATRSLNAPLSSLTVTTRAQQEALRVRDLPSRSSMDWRLRLAARQGNLVDVDNSIGVAPGAKEGFDTFDTQKPPAVGIGTSLYLGLEGANETGRSVAFADDVRAPVAGTKTWNFSVTASQSGEVTLFWPNANQLPRGVEPYLTDLANGKRTAIRSAGGYRFTGVAGATHRFRIEVGTPKTTPLAITNTKATSSRSTGSTNYQFSFVTTQEAEVTVEVKTLQGRTVRRLATRAKAGAETRVLWNGRDDSGNSVPHGPYLVGITARDGSGATVHQNIPAMNVR